MAGRRAKRHLGWTRPHAADGSTLDAMEQRRCTKARARTARVAPDGAVRRPAVVTILAVIRIFTAIAYAAVAIALLTDSSATLQAILGPRATGSGSLARLLDATATLSATSLALASLIAGILLLRMRQIGWTLTMLLAGISLASSIVLWWVDGLVNSIALANEVVTVFYLNQRQVREAFGITRRRPGRARRQADERSTRARTAEGPR
jgi:ABC-type multidrug transport system fused ATPase/permease subunit